MEIKKIGTSKIAHVVINEIENQYAQVIKEKTKEVKASLEFDERLIALQKLADNIQEEDLKNAIKSAIKIYTETIIKNALANYKQYLTWQEKELIKGEIQLMAHQNRFANYTVTELASLLKP